MIYDKVYIISYVKNIDKQEHIKQTLNNLSINNFEFIYGIDVYLSNLCEIKIYDNDIDHSFVINDNIPNSYVSHAISCGIAHFTALQHAYYSNLNNCLIIEDDVLLYKDLNYVNNTLSNAPEDADVIQYGYIIFDKTYKFKRKEELFFKDIWSAGTQCYGIMNRIALKKIIDNYLDTFYESDNMMLYKNLIVYKTSIPIFIDPHHNGNRKYNVNLIDNYIT